MQSEEIEFEQRKLEDNLPEVPCVYFLMNNIELCYIGQTVNLKRRIGEHNFRLNPNLYVGDEPIERNLFDSVFYFIVVDEKERVKFESDLICDYEPKLNYCGLFTSSINIPKGMSYADVYEIYRSWGIIHS